MLGYGYLRDKPKQNVQQQIFQIVGQEFVQTAYKGTDGWKNLRSLLNKWLKEISDKKDIGITIQPKGKNYFTTRGRPVRSILIQVEYEDELITLSFEQQKAYDYLAGYGLSERQRFKIICDFDFRTITNRITNGIVAKTDHYGNRYYGEYKRPDHRKIENVPGYIYGVIFGYGKKKSST
jgi:hypothetical protein